MSLRQRIQTEYGTVIVCAVVGALVGTLIFVIGLLTGIWLFVAGGALLGIPGGIALVLLEKWRANFALTKVTVRLPWMPEAEFVVNKHYRLAAWRLFVETMTRIATQPLDNESGRLREALTSLHSLFQTTREMLKEIEPTPTTEGWTVELLAIQMLNEHLRPFLANWHPRVPDYATDEADAEFDEAKCRKELEELRQRLVEYARAFGELAGVQQLDHFFNKNPKS